MLTGRQMVFAAVVGLHFLAIASLMTMRIDVDKKTVPGFKPITPVAQVEPPPAPPKLEVIPATRTVLVPDMPGPIIERSEAPSIPVEVGPALPQGNEVTEGLPRGTAVIAATGLTSRTTRSPDDYYPAVSIQLQEEGVAEVHVCVGPTGRLEGAPSVARTSGSRRLDAAAVKWAGEALTFTPATRNGAAVSACRDYRVRFSLK
jgi:TonB family protein